MSTMKELVRKNRSYRGFDESFQLTREDLMELVDLARLTASTVNKQPFKYYLAYEKEDVDKIQPWTGWARALPHMKLPHEGMCPTAFIVVCHDTDLIEDTPKFTRDVGIVAQTILLGAVEKGLGGCMIGNFGPAKISAALDLPANLIPKLVIALGKPAETVVLTDVPEDGNTNYYRDENDVHYVPKRALEDIIL